MINTYKKAYAHENDTRKKYLCAGCAAKRMALSGNGMADPRDVDFKLWGEWQKTECKRKKKGWAQFYTWLETNFAVHIRADNKPGLVVLKEDDYFKLVEAAQ